MERELKERFDRIDKKLKNLEAKIEDLESTCDPMSGDVLTGTSGKLDEILTILREKLD